MHAAEISWSWSVLPIAVVLLAATWRRAPDWVLERTSWLARWRLGSTLAIPAAVLGAAVISVRICEIPWVEPGFDVEEFLKPLTAEQRETAGMYIQATRILRLSRFPDGQLAPAAMRADGTRAEPTLDNQRRWLEKSEEAITLLLTASRRPGGRYWDPVEGRTVLGDGYLLSELAEALPASARLLEAGGKLGQAWERYTAAIRMANCVRTEASLQLRLNGDRLEAAVCDQLPGWAAHPQQTPERIKAALRELEGLSREVPSATSAIKDAYVAAVRPLEGDFRRIESQDPKSVRMLRLAYGLLPWETARARRLASYFTVKNLDRIESLEQSLASEAATTLPRIASYTDSDPRWREYREPEAWTRTTPLASPDCWRMRDGFPDENLLQQEMYRRVVRVQLALFAWRHEHGQFPQTLDALVGPYFDQLPLDPYCGRPFRYEPKGWPWDVRWIASNGSLLSGLQYRAVGPAAQMAIVVPAGCPFLWSGDNVAGLSRSQSDEPPTMLLEGNVQVYSGYLFPLDPKITSPTSR
jgi:hypothetical protein